MSVGFGEDEGDPGALQFDERMPVNKKCLHCPKIHSII
jgi:hypothetical protein